MTLDHAAQAAADRALVQVKHGGSSIDLHSLFVRAFRQGYQQAQKDALRPPQPAPKFHLIDEDEKI